MKGGTTVSDLNVKQAASELNLNPETVRQLADQGRLRGAYKGGRGGKTSPWRIPPRALDLYRSSQPQGYRA
ncbi:helix-turn-helix domain-containing protein [Glutamicibacter sp. V16R2B1]|uniref:helix-turn-helix domain-containing protein n=1 Tax=Glutamicibacter creatinolyticus TaxID=162496 RepID=UPI0010FE06CD|nr:helix-turn-helix domain-containing protein [Glutamicibacter sp. V16R2B1]